MTRLIVRVGYQGVAIPQPRETAWTVSATGHAWLFLVLEVDGANELDIEDIANAVYEADNKPGDLSALATLIREAQRRRIMDRPHHSLSVGDRVRVGDDTVICASDGWQRPRVHV